MRTRTFRAVVVLFAASTAPVHGQVPQAGFSTFGMPGMIDMPTARVLPDGTLGLSIVSFPGTQRATLSFQALPRVTLSFRYASISEWLPGVRTWDRSFDLHWQIREESRFLPALALGLRDFIGTGGYSGEYVVATRSFGPRLNASLGMGWGRLASHGGFSNPLSALHPGFADRPGTHAITGGLVEFRNFFRGNAALFGGMEYQATDRLTLLAEYSSDAYVRERTFVRHRTPVNLGFRYQLGQNSSVSGFLLHGSVVGLAASFSLNPT